MGRVIHFDKLWSDNIEIQQNIFIRKAEIFCEDFIKDNNRITSLAEKDIVTWIFDNSVRRNFILKPFSLQLDCQIEDIKYYKEVTDPFIINGEKPGDIDLLIVNSLKPNQAIGIEVKRVKASVKNIKNENLTKLKSASIGVKQANRIHKIIGFYLSYLMIIVEIDAVEQKATNMFMKNLVQKQFHDLIIQFDESEIHENVGVIYVFATQPTGKNFNDMYILEIGFGKKAKPNEQKYDLTEKVFNFLKIKH